MRSILILNPKGGCGKTTLATNLAGYYASQGKAVALADFDPQGSSLDWLAARPEDRAVIHGINACEEAVRPPRNTEYLILDAPAAVHGRELSAFMRRAETLVIPVLPSPLDVRAATRFIQELKAARKVANRDIKLATVANRVREQTLAAHALNDYLRQQKLPDGRKLPFLAVLRASQNYVRAAARGLSLFEMAPSQTQPDREMWLPLLRWLNSTRSRP